MADDQTIKIYDDRAADYAERFASENTGDPLLTAFIDACPAGGRVLDLGCGPGASAALMAKSGLVVDALDASAEMVAMAAKHPGVTARQARFEEVGGEAIYDGIWANFSLLHAARSTLPHILAALHMALKPGGRLHVAMKLGEGEARDDIGRLYTYVTESELEGLLTTVGFTITDKRFGSGAGLDGGISHWIQVTAHG